MSASFDRSQELVEAHRQRTTDVHGIADTAALVVEDDPRLTDARAPTAHAHPIVDVTGLDAALAGKQDAASAATDADLAAEVAARTAADTAEADARAAADDALGTALDLKADLVGGVIPTGQIPAIAMGQTVSAATQAEMLALTGAQVQPGDVVIRSDLAGRRFLLADPDPSVLGHWIALEVPDAVSSVNGQQGAIVLGAGDVGAPTVVDLNTEATARTNADDAEATVRAAADAALTAAIASKQDAATAVTDAELGAEAAARAAGDAVKISAPYAGGAPAGGNDKDLAVRTDEALPPGASGTNLGLWQKQGAAYVRVAPRLKHADNHAVGGIDPLRPSDLGEFFDQRRSSEVSTLPRMLGVAVTLSSGNTYAAIAFARTAGTFTKCRFATRGAGAGVTDLRVGVWDTSGTKLTETADLSGSFAQNTLFDNVALGSAVTLPAGGAVFLGLGSLASTAIQVHGLSVVLAGISSLAPVLARGSFSALTPGAALPSLTTTNVVFLPWVELIP